ncbi:MAG: HIT family protein [Pseudomonadota bacterium]
MTCIFCEILNGQSPAAFIEQQDRVSAFIALDRHPLIVLNSHAECLKDLDHGTAADLMHLICDVAQALKETTRCQGVNFILSDGAAAGQDVFHVHMHVMPRWLNDDVTLAWNTSMTPISSRESLARKLAQVLAP